MANTADQLREYESQLAEVVVLLKDSPEDDSLLALKSDLLELIGITKAEAKPTGKVNAFDQALRTAVVNSVGLEEKQSGTAAKSQEASAKFPVATAITEDTKDRPKKKSTKVKSEFEVPTNLVIQDSDSTAERNRKRRALKSLKSKWRESVKEAESEKKQKSWKSFQKKKKMTADSMFKTGDTAVGVVSTAGRHLTEFEERKRFRK